MTTHPHLIEDITTARSFALAGRAIFTVKNTETDNRVTYRIEKTDEDNVFNVLVFTGSDNSVKSSYNTLGTIVQDRYFFRGLYAAALDLKKAAQDADDKWLVEFVSNCIGRMQKKQPLSEKQESCLRKNCKKFEVEMSLVAFDDMKAKVFYWLWVNHLGPSKALPTQVQFWHEGRCGHCGRRLTVPASIFTGFGPDCAEKLGIILTEAA